MSFSYPISKNGERTILRSLLLGVTNAYYYAISGKREEVESATGRIRHELERMEQKSEYVSFFERYQRDVDLIKSACIDLHCSHSFNTSLRTSLEESLQQVSDSLRQTDLSVLSSFDVSPRFLLATG